MRSWQLPKTASRTKRRSTPVLAWRRARPRRLIYSRLRVLLRRAPPRAGCIAIIWRNSEQPTEDGRRISGQQDISSSVLCPLSSVLRSPAHLVDRRAGSPVHGLARDDEALLLVKADCPGIVLVDVEVE